MPRMSEAEKQRSHARILEAAAELLREKGIDATSVGEVMQAAGMTHGGFYRHFDSKTALVVAAFEHAVTTVVSDLEAADSDAVRDKARDAYIDQYLSAQHVKNRGSGCPLAALAGELARETGPARQAASETVTRMAGLLNREETDANRQGKAIMAFLLGTVVLARISENEDDRSALLEAGTTGVQLLLEHWEEPQTTD